jgi:hypothetical protein
MVLLVIEASSSPFPATTSLHPLRRRGLLCLVLGGGIRNRQTHTKLLEVFVPPSRTKQLRRHSLSLTLCDVLSDLRLDRDHATIGQVVCRAGGLARRLFAWDKSKPLVIWIFHCFSATRVIR